MKRTKINQFTQTLKLIQLVNFANQFATAATSNWNFSIKYSSDEFHSSGAHYFFLDVLSRPKTYDENNCSCARQLNCSQLPSYRLGHPNLLLTETIPGFRASCQLLDTFLQSSLSCLYNETCLNLMRSSIYYSTPVPVQILPHTSLWPPNTPIESILDQLFISEWSFQISYDQYFNACAPRTCQYSYMIKYDRIYVMSTLFGLFGGPTKGLHIIVSFMAFIVIKASKRCKKKQTITADIEQAKIFMINRDNNPCEIPYLSTEINNITQVI